jgi:hypothetical protein
VHTPCGGPSSHDGAMAEGIEKRDRLYFCVDWKETWPLNEMYEPLLIFVLLPYSVSQPELDKRARLIQKACAAKRLVRSI